MANNFKIWTSPEKRRSDMASSKTVLNFEKKTSLCNHLDILHQNKMPTLDCTPYPDCVPVVWPEACIGNWYEITASPDLIFLN